MHKSSFKLDHRRTSTTLSEHVWKLKNKNINFNIKLEVVKKWSHSHQVIKCANFVYKKKNYPSLGPHHLNKRSEIFGHCINRKKFLLSNTNKLLSTDEGL